MRHSAAKKKSSLPVHKQEDVSDQAKAILAGLRYLSTQAQKAKMTSIARMINCTTSDILYWIQNSMVQDDQSIDAESLLIDNSLYTALDFLAKYASIEDIEIRQEILIIVERMRNEKRAESKIKASDA